jgi:hypothetical protein
MGANDYTRLFIGRKQASDDLGKWAEDSFQQIQQFINSQGGSVGLFSNVRNNILAPATPTDMTVTNKLWDYFTMGSTGTPGLVTLRDPGIYQMMATVQFFNLSTSPSTIEILSVTTSLYAANGVLNDARDMGGLGNDAFCNGAVTMEVKNTPVTIKLQSVVSASTTAQAQIVNWSVTKLFPIPSNK